MSNKIKKSFYSYRSDDDTLQNPPANFTTFIQLKQKILFYFFYVLKLEKKKEFLNFCVKYM